MRWSIRVLCSDVSEFYTHLRQMGIGIEDVRNDGCGYYMVMVVFQ